MRPVGRLSVVALWRWALVLPAYADDPTPVAPGCRADVTAGVYRPERLELLAACQAATGSVATVREEPDGDVHIGLLLDAGQEGLLCGSNATAQGGALVLEIIPGDRAAIPTPAVGDRVTAIGAHVRDTVHDWCELHPVWSLTINDQAYAHDAPDLAATIPGDDDAAGAAAPAATNAPAPATSGYGGPYDPLGPDRDCNDFTKQAEAQAFFIAAGGPSTDRHRLDADHDGIACETLP